MSELWTADDWHLFLCQHCDNRATSPNGLNTVALKIADTMDEIRRDRSGVHTPDVQERIAELQYEAGMYKSLYENAVKVIREVNRIVHVPTKETEHRSADRHFMADFDAIRRLTSSISSAHSRSDK